MQIHTIIKREFSENLSILTIFSLGLIIFGVRVHIIDALAVSMPYWDDWGMAGFLNNYVKGELKLADFFTPVNEHRMVFNRLISITIFDLNQQQWDPQIMMIVNAGIWTLTGLLLVLIARRYQHEVKPIVLLTLILAIWLYPISPVNALWGIQTHNYMMILLSVSACWFINQRYMSASWWFGVFCMFCAGLSMAGGSFVAAAITVIFILVATIDKNNRKQFLITAAISSVATMFGLMLILTQSQSGAPQESWNLSYSLLTFSKSMSWPLVRQVWPFLIFALPILLLVKDVLLDKTQATPLVRFVLCLYFFVLSLALAIAVVRAFEGQGPSRRYMEFLALGQVASLLALILVQDRLAPSLKNSLITVWLAAIIIALPFQIEILRFTLEDRENTIPFQTGNMHRFIYENDATALIDKPFRHVPFHNGQRLADALLEFASNDILPFQLQKPEPLITASTQSSIFVKNGSYLIQSDKKGVDYNGVPMLGSYDLNSENGMNAVGDFESAAFTLTRPFMMVGTLGLLGIENLSLTLVNTQTNTHRLLVPEEAGLQVSDTWLENFYAVEPGTYKLIASDQNPNFWFGFTAPRSVGRLSYLAQQLLERASLFWQLGLILLLLAQRKKISAFFSLR